VIDRRVPSDAAFGPRSAYDPWTDLAENWPEVGTVLRPMRGTLLGELRYPVIALRAGTSSAQRRCTLTHEIVHLERGVTDCGPWSGREERRVDVEVAQRLVPIALLVTTVREGGGLEHPGALARLADVDLDTWLLRLTVLSRAERAQLARAVRNLDSAA
jgi:hypothetical protein